MRILIIDDDPSVSDLLELVLAPTQAEIRRAYNGDQGLQIVKDFEPDIVLLDYMMPGMDGQQTTRSIRKITNVPILILSVLDDPVILAKVLNDGADDYLIKPVSRGVLIAHINNLLRRSTDRSPDRPPLQVSLQSALQ